MGFLILLPSIAHVLFGVSLMEERLSSVFLLPLDLFMTYVFMFSVITENLKGFHTY